MQLMRFRLNKEWLLGSELRLLIQLLAELGDDNSYEYTLVHKGLIVRVDKLTSTEECLKNYLNAAITMELIDSWEQL